MYETITNIMTNTNNITSNNKWSDIFYLSIAHTTIFNFQNWNPQKIENLFHIYLEASQYNEQLFRIIIQYDRKSGICFRFTENFTT